MSLTDFGNLTQDKVARKNLNNREIENKSELQIDELNFENTNLLLYCHNQLEILLGGYLLLLRGQFCQWGLKE